MWPEALSVLHSLHPRLAGPGFANRRSLGLVVSPHFLSRRWRSSRTLPEKRGPTEILLERKTDTYPRRCDFCHSRGNSRRLPPRRIRKGRFRGRGARASASRFLRSVALLVFFPAAAGAGVIPADLVVASMNSLWCDWLFSAIEDERWLGA